MSKFEIKRTICNEIEEKKGKLILIESDRKAYRENLDDALSDCKKRIQELRKENTKFRKQLFERLKSDEHIINVAFQRKPSDRAMFIKRTCSEALETLNYKVCGNLKQLNLLKYLTEIKHIKFQNRENEFNNLYFESTYVSDTISGVSEEGQNIRDLENRLDKASLKYGEAGQINKVYVQIIEKLQEEQRHYGKNLDALENEISNSKIDLCNVLVMKTDAAMARDSAINELRVKEDIVYQERKKREKELNYMKQIVEDNRGPNFKIEKRIQSRESNILGESSLPNTINLTTEEEETKIRTFDECYKHIQELSGVSNLQDAVERFRNQNSTEIQLRKIIDELEKQNIKLRKEKGKISCKLNINKFEGETRDMTNEEEIMNVNSDLKNKEFKNNIIKNNLSEVHVTLFLCKLSLEHINETLSWISFASSSTDNSEDYSFRDFIIYLLDQCDNKATKLIVEINAVEDIDELRKLCFPAILETFNEFYINVVKNISVNNTRRMTSNQIKHMLDEEDNESGDEDNNLPGRRALKKRSFQFVESKTKKVIKKKKKSKDK